MTDRKKIIPLHLAYRRHSSLEMEGFQIRAFFPVHAEIDEEGIIVGPVNYSYEADGLRLTQEEMDEILFAPFNMLSPPLELGALWMKVTNDLSEAVEQMYRLAALRRNKRVMRSHNLIIEFESEYAALPRFQIKTDERITIDAIINHLTSSSTILMLNQHGDCLSLSGEGIHLHYARKMFRSAPISIITLLDVLCSNRSITLTGVTPSHRIELIETHRPPARLVITEPPPIIPIS